LFAEGAFSAAFIPMFNKKVADREGPGLEAGVAFAQDALSVLLPALIVMTLLLELFAWPATYIISGGFNSVVGGWNSQFDAQILDCRRRADPAEHRASGRPHFLPYSQCSADRREPG